MKKLIYSIISFVLVSTIVISAPIRKSDSTELLKFYTATGSGAWKVTTNWRSDKPVSTWFGITTEVKDISGVPTEVVTKINLRANQLEGELPTNLVLPDLQVLDLSFNNLVGRIPKYFMNKLVTLDLSTNSFVNGVPDLNSYYPVLENLIVFNNQKLGGTFANQTINTLKQINIGGNEIGGTLPLLNLPNLEVLELSKNAFDGEIPAFVLPKLKVLNLAENYLTGSLPAMTILVIEDINLARNQFSGNFPSIGLNTLKNIDIRGNQFSGSLGDINLPNLETFIAFDNEFNGPTPKIIAPNLLELNISLNKFSGKMSSITAPKLKILDVSSNLITELADLSNFKSLTTFIATNNKLTFEKLGSLPTVGKIAYSPQDTILPLDRVVSGTDYTLTVNLGGSNLIYKWYQSKKVIAGQTTNSYKTTVSKAGAIYCEVTHKTILGLTLTSVSRDPASIAFSDDEFGNLFQFESFPNPTTNKLNVKMSTVASLNLSFELFDCNGSLVNNFGISQVSNNFAKEIDLSGLTSGSYFLKISNGVNNFTSKIVKN